MPYLKYLLDIFRSILSMNLISYIEIAKSYINMVINEIYGVKKNSVIYFRKVYETVVNTETIAIFEIMGWNNIYGSKVKNAYSEQ